VRVDTFGCTLPTVLLSLENSHFNNQSIDAEVKHKNELAKDPVRCSRLQIRGIPLGAVEKQSTWQDTDHR
jgi:hypothetical protein